MENDYKIRIQELSELFSEFRIYPSVCYQDSFVEHFIKTYPDNHYARDLIDFLAFHSYQQDRIGADLPWWGSRYFTNAEETRVFVISQDSNTEDAGSVTFYANLMQIMNEPEYKDFIAEYQRYDGWQMMKDFFKLCHINLDFTYITDARKVYPRESLEYLSKRDSQEIKNQKSRLRRKLLCNKSNIEVNRRLLLSELKLCAPDLVVVLGTSGLTVLGVNEKLTSLLEGGCSIIIDGQQYYVAPFPSRANAIYEKYKNKATNIIKGVLNTKHSDLR